MVQVCSPTCLATPQGVESVGVGVEIIFVGFGLSFWGVGVDDINGLKVVIEEYFISWGIFGKEK